VARSLILWRLSSHQPLPFQADSRLATTTGIQVDVVRFINLISKPL